MSTLPPTPAPEPTLVPEQSPKRPRVILWKWTLVATGVFMAYGMWQCGSGFYQGFKHSKEAVHRFHQELNSGDFETICREADEAFGKDNHDGAVQFLRAVHTKLGDATSESMGSLHVNASTDGTFVTVTFNSTFTGGSAEETFVWVKGMSGLKLHQYRIVSNAFILK
jgi:hypothetical protein